jgi:hypothetical protein
VSPFLYYYEGLLPIVNCFLNSLIKFLLLYFFLIFLLSIKTWFKQDYDFCSEFVNILPHFISLVFKLKKHMELLPVANALFSRKGKSFNFRGWDDET